MICILIFLHISLKTIKVIPRCGMRTTGISTWNVKERYMVEEIKACRNIVQKSMYIVHIVQEFPCGSQFTSELYLYVIFPYLCISLCNIFLCILICTQQISSHVHRSQRCLCSSMLLFFQPSRKTGNNRWAARQISDNDWRPTTDPFPLKLQW